MRKINLMLGLVSIMTVGISQNQLPASGKVGIGTKSPKTDLHIKGDGRIRLEQSGVTAQWDINHRGNYGLEFKENTTGKQAMVFSNSCNVGVGIQIPKEKFHIAGSGPVLLIEGKGTKMPFGTIYNPKLRFKGKVESANLSLEEGLGIGTQFKIQQDGAVITLWNNKILLGFEGAVGRSYNQKVSLNKPWANQMAIGGKFATGYNFSVQGKAVFEHVEVKLQNDWPDYVFADNYQLQSLDEVEKFININSHLPGVPSAKEVESNGINIAEMNAILLKKIEELTLYNIQLSHQLSELEDLVKK